MRYELKALSELPRFPNIPMLGCASVAMEKEEIVGFACLQPMLHMEPLWISPEYRGKVSFNKLHSTLTNYLPQGTPYFAFVPDRKIALICGSIGMKPRGWDVWEGMT